ncbi:MAG: hypothetical protein WDZ83_00160 [Rhizobiaceae bacterium]
MPANWANQGGMTFDMLRQVQASLTVDMIMTPRGDALMTCRSTDSVDQVMARNSDLFSFLPVVNDADQIIGLWKAESWFGQDAPSSEIGNEFERLSEVMVIGADVGILDFITVADERPTRLVVAGDRIAGLVSLSDLQQLPVRAALFALITSFEMVMARNITQRWPDDQEWLNLLSPGRRKKINEAIDEAREKNAHIESVAYSQFVDKTTLIMKGRMLSVSNKIAIPKFDAFRDLRDDLAHANSYANSPGAARQVCSTVRDMLDMKSELLSKLNK